MSTLSEATRGEQSDIEQLVEHRELLEDLAAMDIPFSEDAQRLLDYLDDEGRLS